MSRARAGFNLASLDYAGLRIPRPDVSGSDVYDGVNAEVNRRCTVANHPSSIVVPSIRQAWNAVCEHIGLWTAAIGAIFLILDALLLSILRNKSDWGRQRQS